MMNIASLFTWTSLSHNTHTHTHTHTPN